MVQLFRLCNWIYFNLLKSFEVVLEMKAFEVYNFKMLNVD